MYLEIIDNPQVRRDWLKKQINSPQSWLIDSLLQSRIQTAFCEYWQQRYVSLAYRDVPTARDFLTRNPFVLLSLHHSETEPLPPTNVTLLATAQRLLQLDDAFLQRQIISLSNGELRRLIIARAFMQQPPQILLDDPYAGLDSHFKNLVEQALQALADRGTQVIVASATHIARPPLPRSSPRNQDPQAAEIFSGHNLNISFGDHQVVRNLDWEIRANERWLLSGPNGSGKSSLLAFLTGDHPQIYRNQLRLFGYTPGKNFNIWDHKQRLGFASPEQHHGWAHNAPLVQIVADAFQPLRSNPIAPTTAQLEDSHRILQAMDIPPALRFNDAPYAWQRLALVARALVASKPLIILDEPDQGLDSASRQVLWQIIDNYAQKNLVVSSHHQDNIAMQLNWHLDLSDPSA